MERENAIGLVVLLALVGATVYNSAAPEPPPDPLASMGYATTPANALAVTGAAVAVFTDATRLSEVEALGSEALDVGWLLVPSEDWDAWQEAIKVGPYERAAAIIANRTNDKDETGPAVIGSPPLQPLPAKPADLRELIRTARGSR